MEATGDVERVVTSQDWLKAIPRIFQVLRDQMEDTWPSSQVKLAKPNASSSTRDPEPVSLKDGYRFRRYTDRPTETLGEYGIGGITKKCGLVRSAFRPSDDSTTFPYLVRFLCVCVSFWVVLLIHDMIDSIQCSIISATHQAEQAH